VLPTRVNDIFSMDVTGAGALFMSAASRAEGGDR